MATYEWLVLHSTTTWDLRSTPDGPGDCMDGVLKRKTSVSKDGMEKTALKGPVAPQIRPII